MEIIREAVSFEAGLNLGVIMKCNSVGRRRQPINGRLIEKGSKSRNFEDLKCFVAVPFLLNVEGILLRRHTKCDFELMTRIIDFLNGDTMDTITSKW